MMITSRRPAIVVAVITSKDITALRFHSCRCAALARSTSMANDLEDLESYGGLATARILLFSPQPDLGKTSTTSIPTQYRLLIVLIHGMNCLIKTTPLKSNYHQYFWHVSP